MLKLIQQTVLLVLSLALTLGIGASLFSVNTFAQFDDEFDYEYDFDDPTFDYDYEYDYEYGASATPEMNGAGLGVLIVQCIISILLFIFVGYCFQRISIKLGREDLKYFGYIPLVNLYQMVELAGKPFWWIVLLFLPFINLIALAIIYMEIAKKTGKEGWYGLLMFVPIVNFFIIWKLGSK